MTKVNHNKTKILPASQTTKPSICLRQVGYTYGVSTPWAHKALEDVTLTITSGSRVLIVGDNGSGKSTLAWILAGMLAPTTGTAHFGDEPLTSQVTQLGLLIQHTRLQLLSPTVQSEFSTFGISTDRTTEIMAQMGLSSIPVDQRIDALSVGQQRRVGLAVLLARSCDIVVLDEPLSGLDTKGCHGVTEAVKRLNPSTIVITVTHDLAASASLGNRLLRLDNKQIVEDSEL